MKILANDRFNVYGWFVCSLAALFYTYEYILRIEPSIMMPQLMHYFNVNALGFSLISAVYYYAYTPLQLVVGITTDYFGAKKTLLSALLFCILGSFIFSITQNLDVATMARFLMGIGSAFAFVGALNLAAIWLPRSQFALAAGVTSALGMLGAMIADIEMSKIIQFEYLSWHHLLGLISLIGVALLIFFVFFLSDKKVNSPNSISNSNSNSIPNSILTIKENYFQLIKENLTIVTQWPIIKAGIIGCMLFSSLTVFADLWGPSYIHAITGITPPLAAKLNTLVYLGWLIGAPLCGWLVDKLKQRRLPLLIGTALTLITFTGILLPIHNLYVLALLLFLLGLFSSVEIICFSMGHDLVPLKCNATAMSFVNSIIMLGGMIFQPLVGFLLNLSGSGQEDNLGIKIYNATNYRFALAIVVLMLLAALVLAYFSKETYSVGQSK